MVKRLFLVILFVFLLGSSSYANTEPEQRKSSEKPILIIVADKIDSLEFYQSPQKGIQRLISEAACGLMSIRSGSGYTHSYSAFLSIGSGNRSTAMGKYNGVFDKEQELDGLDSGNFWDLITGDLSKLEENNIVVPEIGWIQNQALISDRKYIPGLLGTTFRDNGWQTIIIGNTDNSFALNRPSGYLLMDKMGVIDNGDIDTGLNRVDPSYPFLYRFDSQRVMMELQRNIGVKKVVVVDYGDFARLDNYREQMLPAQYQKIKTITWNRFSGFINEVLNKWSVSDLNLMLISPSLSKESFNSKKWMTPIVIRTELFSPGLVTSGTTKWNGLVSNIDILPTLAGFSKIKPDGKFPGRMIKPVKSKMYQDTLVKLNVKLNTVNSQQRVLIDWYLGLISMGWIMAILSVLLNKQSAGNWVLSLVAVIPLALIIIPIFPEWSWNISGFFLLILFGSLGSFLWTRKYPIENYYFILSATLWLIFVLDQITGWNLIRFSALGYNPATGSRYYGLGNEFMGTFLAISLMISHFSSVISKKRWLAVGVLGISVLILGMPWWGINFGGTLAATVGFSYYSIQLFQVKLNFHKLGIFGGMGVAAISILGFWDASRAPELQTHLGRFFNLFIQGNYIEVGDVIFRKLAINFRLLLVSPWARIIILTLVIMIIIKIVNQKNALKANLGWNSIWISGMAAFFFNDSGVVAFGTCLAYGFTYYLADVIGSFPEDFLKNRKPSI